MTRGDGTPVNAVFGFTKMVMKLVDDADADHIAVVFDTKRKTFRNDIYADYKANRVAPPEELIPQFDLVRQATDALNVSRVEMEGFEADDLIATYAKLAREQGADVTIVSSDKDLMQIVDEKTTMLDAMKNRRIGPADVVEKFGVTPDKVVDVQALAGDKTDNVPGIRGIGVKTAAQLINEYGDLDTLLARAEEIKQPKRRASLISEADAARVSRELVRLRDDITIKQELASFAVRAPDPSTLLSFLQEQTFKSLVTVVASRFGVTPPEPKDSEAATVQSNADQEPAPAKPTPPQLFASLEETTYELVQTTDALNAWVEGIYAVGRVAVDTETTSLDSMSARLVGISLSCAPGEGCYIPLGHRRAEIQGGFDFGDGGDSGDSAGSDTNAAGLLPGQISMDEALAVLKPVLEDPSILKIGQNIKYDMQIFARHGIHVSPVDDTMLLSYVTEGGLHSHGMDRMAERHLNYATIKFSDVAGSGRSQVTFDLVALDKALNYAAEDADITLRLHHILKQKLVDDRLIRVYETLERPLIHVLDRMEQTGIRVDAGVLKSLSRDFASRIGDLETDIYALAGREFNVASPKQLGEVLFDDLGLPGGRKGKTGAYVTGAEILEGLAAAGHDLPTKVLEFRQLSKLKSTYTDTLIDQINAKTGRVHTSYAQAVASTGRLSSSDPNLQNIPIRTEEGRKIRKAFIPEQGYTLMSADYSQIELRLLAHVAKIDALKEAFHNDLDIHAMTASQVFNVPMDGMDPMVRRNAKAINFGIIYGISAFGLARQLDISRTDAQSYIDAYFERYPGIRQYMNDTIAHARKYGFVETLYGRRCHTSEINDRQPNRRGFAERAAINAPIQGGAADIIKRAMIQLPGALDKAGLGARMLLQVHDELIFEVPDAELIQTEELVKTVMENAARLDVPLVVDPGHGNTWDEAH